MITVMNSTSRERESMKETETGLDPQLWHACAGGMVQMPPINSKVFYFPQGHIEHAQVNIDPKTCPKNLPPLIPSKISSIKYLADQESDEVYAKIRLIPIRAHDFDFSDDTNNQEITTDQGSSDKPASFAKTLTQSDANNGGGFSVPRYCAETIFPRLDYSAEPPVQTILAKDVHGVTWKFRHIYRGTPRRHLLTTGWSNFVNQKKLVAGDSIVFLRAENGDLCVGIRRAKRGIGGAPESPMGWNGNCGLSSNSSLCSNSYGGGYAAFLREDDNNNNMIRRTLSGNNNNNNNNNGSAGGTVGKVSVESVLEGITLAAKGQPFEVVYYPRASTPEFFVKASTVKGAMQVQWCGGMRFKMAFETEDSSRISWFMGTVSSVQVVDPIHWPNSPWRLLQVAWDEPDLLQNVKRVNPWLVELVASMPTIHMSPFSPQRKKLRLSQAPDLPFFEQQQQLQLPMPSYPTSSIINTTTLTPNGPLFGLPDKIVHAVGIQGSRHSHHHLGLGHFLSDHLHKFNGPPPPPPAKFPFTNLFTKSKTNENLSSFLTMGIPDHSPMKTDTTATTTTTTTPKFMLFGKPILTEQQILQSSSGDSTTRSTTSDGESNGTSGSSSNVDRTNNNVGMSYEDLCKKITKRAWQGNVREPEQCAAL